jgi:plastocyanin
MPGRILTAALLLSVSLGSVPARAETIEIEMRDLGFSKAAANARVGDTIVWVNKDIFAHTATARSGDWKVTLPPGKKGSVVLKKKGSFEYYCEYHPNMVARLVVAEKKSSKKK